MSIRRTALKQSTKTPGDESLKGSSNAIGIEKDNRQVGSEKESGASSIEQFSLLFTVTRFPRADPISLSQVAFRTQ